MELWEILVPVSNNHGRKYDIVYHQEWDNKVREITHGLTILRSAKGSWLDPEGVFQEERMIPVRFAGNEAQAKQVMQLTLVHYRQRAVMCYKISTECFIYSEEDFEI